MYLRPHPCVTASPLSLEERALARVSKDGGRLRALLPSFETLATQAPQDEDRVCGDAESIHYDSIVKQPSRFQMCKNIPATHIARVVPFGSAQKRAWGMPGAQCTRSLVCESGGWNAHEYSQRVHRKRPAFPHAMVLRLIPRSPR